MTELLQQAVIKAVPQLQVKTMRQYCRFLQEVEDVPMFCLNVCRWTRLLLEIWLLDYCKK